MVWKMGRLKDYIFLFFCSKLKSTYLTLTTEEKQSFYSGSGKGIPCADRAQFSLFMFLQKERRKRGVAYGIDSITRPTVRFLMVESLLVRTCACISSITSKSQAKSYFFQVRPPQRQHHDVVRPPERPRGRPGGGGDRAHAQGQAHLQLKEE